MGKWCVCCIVTCSIGSIFTGLVFVLPIVLSIVLDPRVSVEDAALTRFALAMKPTSLSYNLSAIISVHNPNYYFGIYYDQVQADFLFEGQRFDWLTLSTFYQHRKRTYKYYPVIGGQSDITLGTTGLNNFMRENQTGLFNLEVRIDAYVRFKPRKVRCRFLVTCPFAVQLTAATAGTTSHPFQRTKCDLSYPYDGNGKCFCQKTNSCDSS